jgi:DNA-binding GntR family transcriptional regulator
MTEAPTGALRLRKVSGVRAPIRDETVSILRTAILTGELVPGQHLVERELCDATGASRTTLRESLRTLEAEGFITRRATRGYEVIDLAEEDARAVFEVREELEGLASFLAAQRITDQELDQLAEAVATFAKAAEAIELPAMLIAKLRFYDLLTAASGNEILVEMLRSLHGRCNAVRARSLSRPGRPAASVAEMESILGALYERDAERARQLARVHAVSAAGAFSDEAEDADRAG